MKIIKKVQKEFDEFLDSPVLPYLKEEEGWLETDLENAATYYKPKYAKKKIKELQTRL